MNIIHMRYDEYSQINFSVAPRKNVQLENIFHLHGHPHWNNDAGNKKYFLVEHFCEELRKNKFVNIHHISYE